MKFEGEVFEERGVRFDGNEFIGCTFRQCNLKYGGSGPVTLESCDFHDCKWAFTGPAQATLNFMTAMYQSSDWGKHLIEQTFENIKRGEHPELSKS